MKIAVAEVIAGVIESSAEPAGIIEVAGPREEDLVELARMLVARRGTPVTVPGVRDPAAPTPPTILLATHSQ